MTVELSKSQKKLARELIDTALQRECDRFLEETKTFIANRAQGNKKPHEAYLKLYKSVEAFDERIEKTYDDLRGSKYFMIIIGLVLDKVLTPDDVNRFDEELKAKLAYAIRIWEPDFKL